MERERSRGWTKKGGATTSWAGEGLLCASSYGYSTSNRWSSPTIDRPPSDRRSPTSYVRSASNGWPSSNDQPTS